MTGFEPPRLTPRAAPLSTFVTPGVTRPALERTDFTSSFAGLQRSLSNLQDQRLAQKDATDARDAQLEASELGLNLLEELPSDENSDKIREHFAALGRPELSPTFMSHLRLHGGRRWVEKNNYQRELAKMVEVASEPDSDLTVDEHVAQLRQRVMAFLPETMSGQFKRGVASRMHEMESAVKDTIYKELQRKSRKAGQLNLQEEGRNVVKDLIGVMLSDRPNNIKAVHVDRGVSVLQTLAARAKSEGVADINETLMSGVTSAIREMADDLDEDFAGHAIDFLRDLEVVEGRRFGAGKNGDVLLALENELIRKADRRGLMDARQVTELSRQIEARFNREWEPNKFTTREELEQWFDTTVAELGFDDPMAFGGLEESLWLSIPAKRDEVADPAFLRKIMDDKGTSREAKVTLLEQAPWDVKKTPEWQRAMQEAEKDVDSRQFAEIVTRVEAEMGVDPRTLSPEQRALYTRERDRYVAATRQAFQTHGDLAKAHSDVATQINSNQNVAVIREPQDSQARKVAISDPQLRGHYATVALRVFPKPVAELGRPPEPDIMADERAKLEVQLQERAEQTGFDLLQQPRIRELLRRTPIEQRDAVLASQIRRALEVKVRHIKDEGATSTSLQKMSASFSAGQGEVTTKVTARAIQRLGLPTKGIGGDYREALIAGLAGKRIPWAPGIASLMRPGGPHFEMRPGPGMKTIHIGTPTGGPEDYSELQIRMAAVADALVNDKFHSGTKPDWFMVQKKGKGQRQPSRLWNAQGSRWHGGFSGVGAGDLKFKSGVEAAQEWGRYISSQLPRDRSALIDEARALIQVRGLRLEELQEGKTRDGIPLPVLYGAAWKQELVNQFVPLVSPGDTSEKALKAVEETLGLEGDHSNFFRRVQQRILTTRKTIFDGAYHRVNGSSESLKALWDDTRTLKIK